MYEGAPNWPDEDRFWEIIEKYRVTIFYTAPTAIRAFMKWGDQWPDEARPVEPAAAGHGRRADQPRGVDVVPPGHRRRPLPDRRYLVADRDRRDHDLPAARRHADQARLGHPAVARHRARGRRPSDGNPVPATTRAASWSSAALAGDAADHLRRRRTLQQRPTGARSPAATSPATAPAGTRTATSGSWAASTTCSTSPATGSARWRSRAPWSATRRSPRPPSSASRTSSRARRSPPSSPSRRA